MAEGSSQMETDTQEHVFFVDDESKVRRVVRRTLERAGLHVTCLSSVDECLSHLEDERCDLLITDVKMPGRDGIELLIAVKELQPWLPVVVVTGFGDVPMAVRALKAGAADFIEKPLDRDLLLKTIRATARKSTPQSALLEHSLTKTEMKVLFHIVEGKSNREVAHVLNRSSRTVEVHRRHVMRKLHASNVVELVRRAADLHLFELVEAPGGEVAKP
jgi:FixJ family two-component response regulator